MTAPRLGAAAGAAGVAVWIVDLGLPPLDSWDSGFVFLCAALLSAGAALVAGLVLAGRHIARERGVLGRTAVVLVPLTLWLVLSHVRERRATPEMLARADAVRGTVLGRNLFGNLLLACAEPGRCGRMIARGKHAHAKLNAGDTVTLYFEPPPSETLLDIAPAGPDPRKTARSILWLWLIGGVILAGYGPRHSRWLAGAPRRDPDSRAARPRSV